MKENLRVSVTLMLFFLFVITSCSQKTTTKIREILPPNPPKFLIQINSPPAGAEVTTSTITLKWKGTGIDTYILYFGEDQSNLKKIAENLTNGSYTISNLENNKIYYWQVIGEKDGEIVARSPMGMIRVHLWSSAGKIILTHPIGEDGVSESTTTFSWYSDGFNNRYTIYLGENQNDLQPIATDISKEKFTYYGLKNNTTYYWQVKATTPDGKTLLSPIARFTVNYGLRTFKQVDLSAGRNFCAIDTSGKVWCWGWDNYGQLGIGYKVTKYVCSDGTTASEDFYYFTPVKVKLPDNLTFSQISVSVAGACAVSTDGELWCWGDNTYSGFGAGARKKIYYPIRIDNPQGKKWTKVAVGGENGCAIDEDEKLWCWGKDKLGTFESVDPSKPYFATEASQYNWIDIQASVSGICGLTETHRLFCMGDNSNGTMGFGEGIAFSVIPREVRVPGGGTTWKKFSMGFYTTCGIDENGKLYCWGNNGETLLGTGKFTPYIQYAPVEIGDPDLSWKDVSVGFKTICAVTTSNQVYCWGIGTEGINNWGSLLTYNSPISTATPMLTDLTNVDWTQFSLGDRTGCAIDPDGKLFCWGSRLAYGLPDPEALQCKPLLDKPLEVQNPYFKKWVDVKTVYGGTIALDEDGNMWWGGLGMDRVDGLGLRFPESEIGNQEPLFTSLYPIESTDDTKWKKIGESYIIPGQLSDYQRVNYRPHSFHTCSISKEGKLYCWGSNGSGQLGLGFIDDNNLYSYPLQVTHSYKWIDVATNGWKKQTCAIDENHDLYCWGANNFGHLGIGDELIKTVPFPTKITRPAGVKWEKIYPSLFGFCALSTEKQLYCWGDMDLMSAVTGSYYDSVTTPILISDVSNMKFKKIAFSLMAIYGLTEDNRLYSWGYNVEYLLGRGFETIKENSSKRWKYYEPGEIKNPLGLGWIDISSYLLTACAIDTEHNLWCWGRSGNWDDTYVKAGFNFYTPIIPGYTFEKALSTPHQIKIGDYKFKTVSIGLDRICALTLDDKLYCWGGDSRLLTGLGNETYIHPKLETW